MLEIVKVAISALSSLGVGGIIVLLMNRHYKKKDDLAEQSKKQSEVQQQQLKDMDSKICNLENNLNDLGECLKSTQSDIKSILGELQKQSEVDKLNANANRGLLRDRLLSMYQYYYEEKGYIPTNALESFEHMYQDYHALGGNGMIEDVRQKVLSLDNFPSKK